MNGDTSTQLQMWRHAFIYYFVEIYKRERKRNDTLTFETITGIKKLVLVSEKILRTTQQRGKEAQSREITGRLKWFLRRWNIQWSLIKPHKEEFLSRGGRAEWRLQRAEGEEDNAR